ncbi:hypothetical protein MKK75_13075 [Methylobacterium sp. J-030]|uniref:hypothetical protein n=1 Tax=Methylobacterium sp. J-030 TaxID=2836627 RepID=UPI001FB93B28|nr:hypothetical protein [Methylobacterium sp. J-030]MCJ2069710.1 hypothetical protein [Methylobacterium sp. J-030]
MPISRPDLASALLAAAHIADRSVIAAFIVDAATQPAPNPFPQTSAGAVRQVWRQRAAEFESFEVQAAGLSCLLAVVSNMHVDEVLVQEILRAGPHTANVFHRGDVGQIIGAVLYGKPGCALPALPAPRVLRRAPRARTRIATGQLDLFA